MALRRMAKRVIPGRLLTELRQYLRYDRAGRPVYLRIRLLNALGRMELRERKAPATARQFLFVCFGNIMRSPMCEALTKRALATHPNLHASVVSAGLNATPGRPAHPWSIAAAREFGIDLQNHQARLLTADMVEQADVIFAMDYQNLVQLYCRYPMAKHKILMLSAYCRAEQAATEIRDPYYGDENQTRSCYATLNDCIENLVSTLLDSSAAASNRLITAPNRASAAEPGLDRATNCGAGQHHD